MFGDYHQKQREFLKKKIELGQLSHAYLFTGPKEIGKKFFAVEFVKLLHCLGEKKPCGKCVNCQMIAKNSFPDLMVLGPSGKDEKFGDGGEIKISKVREVQNFLSYKSYYGSFKTVIIDGAENMNQEAQSCFLKTLEEPRGRTILFLISSKPDMLLPTILSRCQTIKFFKSPGLPPSSARLEREQSIFKQLSEVLNSNFSDKFKYVKSIDFESQKPSEILEVIQKYLRYLMLSKIGIKASKEDECIFAGVDILKGYPVSKIKKAIDLSEELNNKLVFANANPKLALEVLLMEI